MFKEASSYLQQEYFDADEREAVREKGGNNYLMVCTCKLYLIFLSLSWVTAASPHTHILCCLCCGTFCWEVSREEEICEEEKEIEREEVHRIDIEVVCFTIILSILFCTVLVNTQGVVRKVVKEESWFSSWFTDTNTS